MRICLILLRLCLHSLVVIANCVKWGFLHNTKVKGRATTGGGAGKGLWNLLHPCFSLREGRAKLRDGCCGEDWDIRQTLAQAPGSVLHNPSASSTSPL